MLKLTLGKIIAASILFAAAIFLLMAGGSIYSIKQLDKAADWVAHTQEVKSRINSVYALTLDLESANRGFLLTGRDEYFNSYSQVKERLDPSLEKLRLLVADNPQQMESWQRLKSLADQKLEQVTTIIERRRQAGYDAALALFNAGEPEQVGTSLHALITQMLQAEDSLLAERRVDNDAEVRQSILAAVMTSAIGIIVLTVATWMIIQQLGGRQKAEAELAKRRAELQGILDNSPAGIFLKDLDGRYILLNQPMQHLLGLEPSACLGKTAADLFPAERAELIRSEDAALIAKGTGDEIEFEIKCADGIQRIYRTLKFPLRDAQGHIYAVGGISTDITERRYMVNELRRALDSAETASRTKSQFLANMSHELRTPLNSIIGFSEILTDRIIGPLNEKQTQYTTNILSSGRHLLLLINDLLDLAKIEAGKVQLELDRVAVAPLVEDAVVHMRGFADRKAVVIDVKPIDRQLTARLDPARAKQIIYNLISNAIKFTPKNGHVTVAAERVTQPIIPPCSDAQGLRLPGDWLSLTVTDTGIGINSDDLERIFAEFEQVDSTFSRQQQGTGLGLSLTRKLVSLHGGYVWAESAGQVNRGSKFFVLQPLNGPAPEVDRPNPAKVAPSNPTPTMAALKAMPPRGTNDRPLVLVVEDDQQASHLMAEHLTSGGYRVAYASTAEEAMRMASELRPTAITLDMVLPDATGMDVLARLKANRATSHIPVVIVSVTDDRQAGLSLGAVEYFVKPVGADRLLDALTRARSTAKKDIHTVLVVDDEPAAHESITAILEPLGYKVLNSISGEDALRLVAQEVPDVAIIDLTMPGMSGFELVNHLREIPATQKLPICIYTAKDLSTAELRWLSDRSAPVTPKPFREHLMAELQRLCAKSS